MAQDACFAHKDAVETVEHIPSLLTLTANTEGPSRAHVLDFCPKAQSRQRHWWGMICGRDQASDPQSTLGNLTPVNLAYFNG
ncbi:UNVERIFIED_CONTAM: hypothetical protein K2H54_015168 [Gekko kuhli]